MKHVNVALFVPHEGCPHRCSFCNQKSISGTSKKLTKEDVDEAVNTALKSEATGRELAFFGGSFTAIDRDYMLYLLEAANKHIDNNSFSGIRISTRPDAIDEEICEILKRYNVTAVELGAQSMDDEVLRLNERGHTAQDVINASKMLKSYDFELGLQMMTGLYGSDDSESLCTAKEIIKLMPNTVRIYPTVVLRDTALALLFEKGKYIPQTIESAVKICSVLLELFEKSDIKVIRVGLHSGGDVMNGYLAGAFHPSLRELCESEIYLRSARLEIQKSKKTKGKIELKVMPRAVSQMIGQKKCNIETLRLEGYDCKVVASANLLKYEVEI